MSSSPSGHAASLSPTIVGPSASAPASATYRWRLLAALWLVVALVVAVPSVGAGFINAQMIKTLQMDRGVYGIGFGLFVLMMGLPAPLVAAAVRRHGIKLPMMVGCLLLFVGALAMATVVHEGIGFIIAFGLVVGAGVVAGGMLPAQVAVAAWFTDRRALAASIVLSAVEVGGFVGPPVLDQVMRASGDWRSGWWLITGLAVAAWITVLAVVRPGRFGSQPDDDRGAAAPLAGTAVHKTREDWLAREVFRTRTFWLLQAYVCVAGMGWIFLLSHGAVHLQDLGFGSREVAASVAMLVAASLVGNLGAGFLGDRVPPHRIAAVTMLLMTLGLALGVQPRGLVGLLLFAVPVGIGYGASQVCLMALIANYFGARVFPTVFGAILAPCTLAAAATAAAAGWCFEHVGSYDRIFYFCTALSLLGSLAIACARPPLRHP